jgi:hypothetical protein
VSDLDPEWSDDDGEPGASGRGAVHGFDVVAPFPMRFIRNASKLTDALGLSVAIDPPSPTGEPLLEWSPRPQRPFAAKLFGVGSGYAFWTNSEGWYRIDPDRSEIAVPSDADPVRRESRLWGVPALLCYVRRGDVPIHAAAVDIGGRAVLFPAPGRSGKTTTAAAFHRAGFRVLAEDLLACRLGDPIQMFPGPALLRLRRDVHQGLALSDATVVEEDHDRVYVSLDRGRRGDGDPIPVAAMVFLRRGEGGGRPTLVRRSVRETLPDLWALSLKLPNEEDQARCFRGIASIAAAVPAWDLRRELSLAELDDVVGAIVTTCG